MGSWAVPTELIAQLHPTPSQCCIRLSALVPDKPHPGANLIMD